MTEKPPDDWREREAASDPELSAKEKEFILTCPNDKEFCYFYSDIATFIKWVQSIEESEPEWCRIGQSGEIIALSAKISKTVVMLKGKGRESLQHSNMVSYGPYKE